MPRRPPRPIKDFTYDLLADWRPYAEPTEGWTYVGTCTMRGKTGALAFRESDIGVAYGASVQPLNQAEKIKVMLDITFKRVPGWELPPQPKGVAAHSTPPGSNPDRRSGS